MTEGGKIIEPDDFQKVLFGEDELGAVVRAHFYVEERLLQLIGLLVKDESYIGKLNLDFSQHVHLATALGLSEGYAKGLRAFGALRNHFAHNLSATLTKERLNSLYDSLGSSEKELVHKAYRLSYDPHETRVPFQDLSPKDQFILIAVALYTLLNLVIGEIQEGRL
ncbi:MAG: hypothetical protein LZF60_340171 [Nitrospira sp.]|nr:MAG: hypothetical protein LZF60_340171 [Nitrospira sp.]